MDIYKVGNKLIPLTKQEYNRLISITANIVRKEIRGVLEDINSGKMEKTVDFVSKTKHVLNGHAAYIPTSQLNKIVVDDVEFPIPDLHDALSITITKADTKDIIKTEVKRLSSILEAEDVLIAHGAGLRLEKQQSISKIKIPKSDSTVKSVVININISLGHEPFEVCIKNTTANNYKNLERDIHTELGVKISKKLIPELEAIVGSSSTPNAYAQSISALGNMPELNLVKQIGDKTLIINVARLLIDMNEIYQDSIDEQWIREVIDVFTKFNNYRAISRVINTRISEVAEVLKDVSLIPEEIKSF